MATATLEDVYATIKRVDDVVRHRPDADFTNGTSDQELQDVIHSVEEIRWLDWAGRVANDDFFEIARARRRLEAVEPRDNHARDAQVDGDGNDCAGYVRERWDLTQEALRNVQIVEGACQRILALKHVRPRNRADMPKARAIIADFMRSIRLNHPELDLEVADFAIDDYRTVIIPPWGYLKAAWAVLSNVIRRPFSDTVINLQTGEVMARE